MANFILLSDARTGSSLVCEAFNNFKDVQSLNDIYWYNGTFLYQAHKTRSTPTNLASFKLIETLKLYKIISKKRLILNENADVATNTWQSINNAICSYIQNHPREFFECLKELCSDSHIMFKTHLYQFEVTELDWIFDLPDTYFIILDRKSRLEQYVSLQIAKNKRLWQNINTSTEKVHIDPLEYLEFKRYTDTKYNFYYKNQLKNRGKDFLELYYEDDILNVTENNGNDLLNKIKNWVATKNIDFEIDRKPIFPRLKRQNFTEMKDKIINYGEFLAFINDLPDYLTD